MLYGDSAVLANVHNQALRHLAAALRCALGRPERSVDAATGHDHVNLAIVAVEIAEKAVENRGEASHVAAPEATIPDPAANRERHPQDE